MGFSGGGSNQTLPHTHDGLIASDGGSLNMDNVTQGGLNAGDVVYSDGVHLQRLAYPGAPAGETLTAAPASTAPSWGAASGGGGMEYVETIEFTGGATSSHTFTLTSSIDLHDYDVVFDYYPVFTGTPRMDMRWNGLTAGNYVVNMIGSVAGTPSGGYWTGATEMQVASIALGFVEIHGTFRSNSFGTGTSGGTWVSVWSNLENNIIELLGGYYAGGVTSISSITFLNSTGTLSAGKIAIWKIQKR